MRDVRRRHIRMPAFTAAMVAVLLVLELSAVGCGQAPKAGNGEQLETVEVAPPPEASIDVESDVKAPERGTTGLTGVVPADFPADVPLFSPATITDFGTTADGRRQLTFATASAPDAVRAKLVAGLLARGWSRQGDGGGGLRFGKNGRRLQLHVQADPVGTAYRIEY